MEYTVKGEPLAEIDFAPESIIDEVVQNVAVILMTPKFSVPLDRGLGLSQTFIDRPVQVAQMIAVSEIMDAIEDYEPRAKVISVDFDGDMGAGKLLPVLKIEIDENYEEEDDAADDDQDDEDDDAEE